MKNTKKIYIFLVILLSASMTAKADIIYVDNDAIGLDDGSTWYNAYIFLQDALYAAAGDPNQIWVAEGTYTPDKSSSDPNSLGNREATFQLINEVAIYGGFASGGGGWSERDPNQYETILSGDLNGNDGPDFANNGENSYHVVTGSGTDETALLDGFTITAGNADGSYGAGMYNDSGSPTLTNCTFSGNSADDNGGGMYNRNNSSPTVTNCMFSGNNTANGAGAECITSPAARS